MIFRWHWLPSPSVPPWRLTPYLAYRGFRANWSVTFPLLIEGFRWRGPGGQDNETASLTVAAWKCSITVRYSRQREGRYT